MIHDTAYMEVPLWKNLDSLRIQNPPIFYANPMPTKNRSQWLRSFFNKWIRLYRGLLQVFGFVLWSSRRGPYVPTLLIAVLVGESTTRLGTLPSQLLEPIYPPTKALANTPAMTRSIANNRTISNAFSFKEIPYQARCQPFMFKRPLSQFHLGLLSKFVESAVSWDLSSPCPTPDAWKLP